MCVCVIENREEKERKKAETNKQFKKQTKRKKEDIKKRKGDVHEPKERKRLREKIETKQK